MGAAPRKIGSAMAETNPEDRTKQYDRTAHLRGKYGWDKAENKSADNVVIAGSITKYSWADGSKNVSIYTDVLDEVPEEEVSISSTSESVTLTVQNQRLHLANLSHEITGATYARKAG